MSQNSGTTTTFEMQLQILSYLPCGPNSHSLVPRNAVLTIDLTYLEVKTDLERLKASPEHHLTRAEKFYGH